MGQGLDALHAVHARRASSYYIAYNSLTGARNIDRINAAGTGASTVMGGSWTRGWTQLVPFKLGNVQHVLLYRGGSGEVKILKITGSGDDVVLSTVSQTTWSTGWTHIVPMTDDGAVHLLRYKQATGLASFDRVAADGSGTQNLGVASLEHALVDDLAVRGGRDRPRADLPHHRPGEDPQAQRRRQRHEHAANKSWTTGLA